MGMEIVLVPGGMVLDGDSARPPPSMERGSAATYFSAHVYYGQTVAHLSNC